MNEQESLNIQKAVRKYQFGGRKKWPITDFQFLKRLHREMYDDVWKWAGEFRQKDQEINIGVSAGNISIDLAKACADCDFWIEHKSYSAVEMAVRYHHRLVVIHPFPNGNGRFSRFVADLLMIHLGLHSLPWGKANISTAGPVREEYIASLQEADLKRFNRLITFATSGVSSAG